MRQLIRKSSALGIPFSCSAGPSIYIGVQTLHAPGHVSIRNSTSFQRSFQATFLQLVGVVIASEAQVLFPVFVIVLFILFTCSSGHSQSQVRHHASISSTPPHYRSASSYEMCPRGRCEDNTRIMWGCLFSPFSSRQVERVSVKAQLAHSLINL